MKQHRATVVGVTEPLPGARLLLLDIPPLSQALPGQFVMARCGSGLDPYLRQALPIHRLLNRGIGLLVRPENASLAWLMSRRLGDVIDLVGPCGHGFDPVGDNDTLVVVAQGSGWQPAAALLDHAPCPVQLLVSAPTSRQLPPAGLVPSSVEYLSFVGTTDDLRWSQALTEAIAWATRIALTGPSSAGELPALYRSVATQLHQSATGLCPGRAQAWLWRELFCGLGCCNGCLVETHQGRKRICTDGPVFDLADLIRM